MVNPLSPAVAVVYCSVSGHVVRMAEAVAEGVRAGAGGTPILVDVGQGAVSWDELAVADAVVFGAPTHLGAPPWPFERFLQESARLWADQSWRALPCAGFTCSFAPAGDKLRVLERFLTVALQHGMLWVGLDVRANQPAIPEGPPLNRLGYRMGAVAQATAEGDPKSMDLADLRTAEYLGARITRVAAALKAA